MTAVGALPEHLQFVSDSQDVAAIKEHIGESAQGYDAFFVVVIPHVYVYDRKHKACQGESVIIYCSTNMLILILLSR